MQAEHDPTRISRSQLNVCLSPCAPTGSRSSKQTGDRYRLRARVLAGGELEGSTRWKSRWPRHHRWASPRVPYNVDTRSHPRPSRSRQDESTLEESCSSCRSLGRPPARRHRHVAKRSVPVHQEDSSAVPSSVNITAAAWRTHSSTRARAASMTDTLTGCSITVVGRAGDARSRSAAGLDPDRDLADRSRPFQAGQRPMRAHSGDALLRNVGRALQGTLRTGDAAVRYAARNSS